MRDSHDFFEGEKLDKDAIEELLKPNLQNEVQSGESEESKQFEGACSLPDPQEDSLHEDAVWTQDERAALHPQKNWPSNVEESWMEIESASEASLSDLAQDLENLRGPSSMAMKGDVGVGASRASTLLEEGLLHFKNENYGACLEVLDNALKLDPANEEVASLLKEAQRKWEDQKAEHELALHVARTKQAAVDLFQKGQYKECVDKFKFLCEVEPGNRDFRDYLEISREQLQKLEQPQLETTEAEPSRILGADKEVTSSMTEPPFESVVSTYEKEPVYPLVQETFAPQPTENFPEYFTDESPNRLASPAASTLPQEELPGSTLSDGMVKSEIEAANPEAEAELKMKRRKMVFLTIAATLFGAVIGTWLASRPNQNSTRMEVQPEPESANVLTNKEPIVGPERLSIPQPSPSEADLKSNAKALFEQGKFLEANQKCDAILEKEPLNSFAHDLKDQIRIHFVRLGNQAMLANRWEEARLAWNNVLKVSSNDPEALRQLKALKVKINKQDELAKATKADLQAKVQDLHQQILSALNSSNYLPPTSGNAIDLIKELNDLSPEDSFGKEKLDQVHRDLLGQARQRLQAKDYAGANAMAHQMQSYFPASPDLKNLLVTLKSEETKLMEARTSWVQKAEASMASGHYLVPPNDNSVAYCNQVLLVDPQNPKALSLRKESFIKAETQAREWIQKGRFDDAHGVYSSLLYFSQSESRFPLNSQDLKAELEKLTFSTYPVIHDHAVGSCTGRLRFNGYIIAYVPSSNSTDGFTQELKEIVRVEPGDKLKVLFKNKTYRFQINAAKGKEDNRDKIESACQRLGLLTGKVN